MNTKVKSEYQKFEKEDWRYCLAVVALLRILCETKQYKNYKSDIEKYLYWYERTNNKKYIKQIYEMITDEQASMLFGICDALGSANHSQTPKDSKEKMVAALIKDINENELAGNVATKILKTLESFCVDSDKRQTAKSAYDLFESGDRTEGLQKLDVNQLAALSVAMKIVLGGNTHELSQQRSEHSVVVDNTKDAPQQLKTSDAVVDGPKPFVENRNSAPKSYVKNNDSRYGWKITIVTGAVVALGAFGMAWYAVVANNEQNEKITTNANDIVKVDKKVESVAQKQNEQNARIEQMLGEMRTNASSLAKKSDVVKLQKDLNKANARVNEIYDEVLKERRKQEAELAKEKLQK